jgi:very-short-patch-repair endonuclease
MCFGFALPSRNNLNIERKDMILEIKEKQRMLSIYKKQLKERATKSEIKVMSILNEEKIRFIEQKGFIAGNNFCIVDIYIPKPYYICLEIDGEYHNTERQRKRDINKEQYIKTLSKKYKIVRITNKEVEEYSSSEILKKILSP